MFKIEIIVIAVVLVIAVFFLYREISVLKKKLYNLENDKVEIEKLKRSITLIHSQIPNIKFAENNENNEEENDDNESELSLEDEEYDSESGSESGSESESESEYESEYESEKEENDDKHNEQMTTYIDENLLVNNVNESEQNVEDIIQYEVSPAKIEHIDENVENNVPGVVEVTNMQEVPVENKEENNEDDIEFKIQTLITNENIKRGQSKKTMQEHFKKKKQRELQDISKRLGISTGGNKEVLSERIVKKIKK